MVRSLLTCCILAGLFVLVTTGVADAESMDGAKAFKKLTRGAANTITGWVEIPKRIQETMQRSGAASGFTWGLLRGFGYGFIRTVAGLYEVVTFPFPAPPGYVSVIEPEYIFTTQPTGDKYSY